MVKHVKYIYIARCSGVSWDIFFPERKICLVRDALEIVITIKHIF